MRIGSVHLIDGRVFVRRRPDDSSNQIQISLSEEHIQSLVLDRTIRKKAKDFIQIAANRIRDFHNQQVRSANNRVSWLEKKCVTVQKSLALRQKWESRRDRSSSQRGKRYSREGKDFLEVVALEAEKIRCIRNTRKRNADWLYRKCNSVAHNMKVRLNLKASQVAGVSDLRDLYFEQNRVCPLSGDALRPEDMKCDHKVPVSKGGSSLKDNLQWVTDQINKAKGEMTNDEFVDMCRKVVARADQCSLGLVTCDEQSCG